MMYVRFPLSLCNVEDLLFERGIDICHETVWLWWNRFGPMSAADIRRQRVNRTRGFRHWRWHLDEMYMKLNGEMVYLWRAVDREGEVLEATSPALATRRPPHLHAQGPEASRISRTDHHRRSALVPRREHRASAHGIEVSTPPAESKLGRMPAGPTAHRAPWPSDVYPVSPITDRPVGLLQSPQCTPKLFYP